MDWVSIYTNTARLTGKLKWACPRFAPPSPGYGTAVLGKEAAMACTVAVEEVIGEHYNKLVKEGIEMGGFGLRKNGLCRLVH